MLRRPSIVVLHILQKSLHTRAVSGQNSAIVSRRSIAWRHPPEVSVGILNADALSVHPLNWRWQSRRVVTCELLAEVKVTLFFEGQERLQRERGHRRTTRRPRISQFHDQRAVRLQQRGEMRCEFGEPADIRAAFQIAVPFLPIQRVRRRRKDQLNLTLKTAPDIRVEYRFNGSLIHLATRCLVAQDR